MLRPLDLGLFSPPAVSALTPPPSMKATQRTIPTLLYSPMVNGKSFCFAKPDIIDVEATPPPPADPSCQNVAGAVPSRNNGTSSAPRPDASTADQGSVVTGSITCHEPGPGYTLRGGTVRKLLDLVMAKGVVQVRGTPTCGKSILSGLLQSYAKQALPDHVVFVTWQSFGGSSRGKRE